MTHFAIEHTIQTRSLRAEASNDIITMLRSTLGDYAMYLNRLRHLATNLNRNAVQRNERRLHSTASRL